jgi:hypothetical protein
VSEFLDHAATGCLLLLRHAPCDTRGINGALVAPGSVGFLSSPECSGITHEYQKGIG